MTEQQKKVYEKHYGKLVGGKIEAVIHDGDGCWGYVVKKEDGKKFVLWIMADEEGNGPGFGDITNAPTV